MNESDIPPKPHQKAIHQQKLWHVYAQQKPLYVAVALMICSVFLIPCGVAVIVYSDKVFESDFRYDNISNYRYSYAAAGVNEVDFSFDGAVYSTGSAVRVDFSLPKSLSAPIYIEYHLKRFYQNYRLFFSSFGRTQVYGTATSLPDTCRPYRWPGEVTDNRQEGYYYPCGALAWSMFNDSISFYKKASDTLICAGDKFSPDGTSLIDQDCHKTGIALGSDVKSSFKPTKEIKQLSGPMWTNAGDPSSSDPFLKEGYYFGEPGHKIPETMDEDLIVWTNVAYLADFSKLYRVIDVDLVAGDYYFYIVENFDVVSFEGEKHVRLVTRNWIGGRNHVLGILLTVVGSVAFVFALCVMIITCIKSRGLNSI